MDSEERERISYQYGVLKLPLVLSVYVIFGHLGQPESGAANHRGMAHISSTPRERWVSRWVLTMWFFFHKVVKLYSPNYGPDFMCV